MSSNISKSLHNNRGIVMSVVNLLLIILIILGIRALLQRRSD